MHTNHTIGLATLTAILLCPWSAKAASYAFVLKDSLWVNVIFYDYHSDGSNPNFEAGGKGRKPGMIQDTLSPDRKPVFRADLCYNSRLDEWFRPSGADSTVQFVFNDVTRRWEWTGLVQSRIDGTGRQGPLWQDRPADSMANIVFYDSLPFVLTDSLTGSYEFIRDNNLLDHQQFFWLDGRGFGTETSRFTHNFSFAMELHHQAVYQGGEFFEFRGDDDAWAFISGTLVADLGGTQHEGRVLLNLDELADTLGLIRGQTYQFDFFYTERLAFQSNCVINTNMLTSQAPGGMIVTPRSTPPSYVSSTSLSDTTLEPGETIRLYAYVYDSAGTHLPEYSRSVAWEFLDESGTVVRNDTVAHYVDFTFPQTDQCIIVRQTFVHPDDPSHTMLRAVSICRVNAPGPAVETYAVLLDTNGNGQFDRIDFYFPDTVVLSQDLPSVEQLIRSVTFLTDDGRRIDIDPVAVERINGTTLHVLLRESAASSGSGWQSGQIQLGNVSLTTGGNRGIVLEVIDSAGPVVQRAVFSPGASTVDGDTLRLIYSEPVNCALLISVPPESVFVFSDRGVVTATAYYGAHYATACSDSFTTEARIVVPGGQLELEPWADSVGFVPASAYVEDRNGIRPPAGPHRAPIEAEITNEIELTVSPNPGSPHKRIPPEVRAAYAGVVGDHTNGTVIGLHSKVPLREITIGTGGWRKVYGTADIYDATGNLVREEMPVDKTTQPGVYGVYWNLENRRTRLVGGGVYLMVVKTTDINGKKNQQRIKVGVQR